MSASTPKTCTQGSGGYLYDALFGSNIADRTGSDTATPRLDAILEGLIDVLRRELGDTEATEQAVLEMGRVIKLPLQEYTAVQAKRAAVLYALWQERDVQEHFRQRGEADLVDDLCSRVLPMVMPRFVANQCQVPDAAVVMTMVMHAMWSEEDIAAAKPRLESTTREHHDGSDGE
jgi:hypothetical protein